MGYAKQLAQRNESKLAIVIDDHSGGSSTNRPVLFNYLEGLKPSLQKVVGLNSENTTFNGYDITEDTYYMP